MPGTRLVLVRHGHSMAQQTGVAAGHRTCAGLSDRGRQQVAALADRLASTGELGRVDALWTSVLPRAIETGQILLEAIGTPPVEQACDLCEFHVGEAADGLPWREVWDRWPRPRDADEHHRQSPGAETWYEMRLRVAGAIDRLADRHAGETVVVATHGGVVAAAMYAMLAIPVSPDPQRAHLSATNSSLTEFVREPVPWGDPGRLAWRLERFNDASHLTGMTDG